ncbi:hypothetical protein V8E54_007196, partial [Elaphomyces granulatus]
MRIILHSKKYYSEHPSTIMAFSSATLLSLRRLWLSFVRSELVQEGYPPFLHRRRFLYLNSGHRCLCHKSLMSYPHWPPSCYEEALDQLRCIVGQDVNHRGYLAHCWKSWLCQKAYLDKTLSREKQDFYRNSVTLVIAECPKLSEWDADSQSSYQKPTTCLRYCGKNFYFSILGGAQRFSEHRYPIRRLKSELDG